MKNTGNTILITGGTSGLGREFAERFHALGNEVVIAGRRRALIDEVTAGKQGLSGYVLDVEDSKAIAAFAAEVVRKHPKLNALINNAGIMKVEDLKGAGPDLKVAEDTIVTNLLAPIRMIAALLPQLRKQPRSTIVNVSSGLAFVPLAATPTYCATKAAIHSYSISLREQLKGSNVEVLELIPPGVQTDLMPGHAVNPMMMPLADFMNETMAMFATEPTPAELCVQRVNFLRRAEAEGRVEQALAALNAAH